MVTLKQLTSKAGFVAAIMLAAIVGGATTGVVMAAIPDSNGNIKTCYRNNGNVIEPKGALRVVDSTNENCATNETALNISQGGGAKTATFHVKDGVVIAARNVTYKWSDDPRDNDPGWCVQPNFVANIYYSQWSDVDTEPTNLDYKCGSGYSYYTYRDSQTLPVAMWFSE